MHTIFVDYLNQILKIYRFSMMLANRFITYPRVILINSNN